MKREKFILPSLSALLAIVFLIGSTGATIVIKTCQTCDTTVNTEIFSPVSDNDHCCVEPDSQCHSASDDIIEKECCTFVTEKLKLSNYVSSESLTFTKITVLQPVLSINTKIFTSSEYQSPPDLHNKHGGRKLILSYCQYLI